MKILTRLRRFSIATLFVALISGSRPLDASGEFDCYNEYCSNGIHDWDCYWDGTQGEQYLGNSQGAIAVCVYLSNLIGPEHLFYCSGNPGSEYPSWGSFQVMFEDPEFCWE